MSQLATIFDTLVEPLRSPVVVRAGVELALLALLSGLLGTWTVLWGFSYTTESLAHAMFPGLVIASLLGLPLLLGGLVGLLAAAAVLLMVARIPVLDRDVAVAAVIAAMLGAGVVIGLGPRVPAGLGSLLFGDVRGVGTGDLLLTGAVALVATACVAGLYPLLLALAFDRDASGVAPRTARAVELALLVLLIAATLVTTRALGTLLATAMLVGPAACARIWARRVPAMMLGAVGLALAAAAAGLYASYQLRIAAGAAVTALVVLAYLGTLAVRALTDARRGVLEVQV